MKNIKPAPLWFLILCLALALCWARYISKEHSVCTQNLLDHQWKAVDGHCIKPGKLNQNLPDGERGEE